MDTMVETWYSCLIDRWWIIGLTILASSLSIVGADYLGLNRPWPLSIVLGAILSFMVMEAYPYAWTLGNGAHIVVWVVLSCTTYLLPQIVAQSSGHSPQTIWDYFEEVDSAYSSEQDDTKKGATPWVEYL